MNNIIFFLQRFERHKLEELRDLHFFTYYRFSERITQERPSLY